MRSFLLVLLLGAIGAAPAAACPRDTLCVTANLVQVAGVPAEMARAPKPRQPVHLGLTRSLDLSDPVLALNVRNDHAPVRPDELEMPWIWKVLREQVYAQMPRYEQPEQQFSFVLSPVVITSLDDSTPGVGVSGDF
jgi:hypothetical protein